MKILEDFFQSNLCKGGSVCKKCRLSRAYRRGIVASFGNPSDIDFDCPEGKTEKDFPSEIEPNIFEMSVSFAKAIGKEAGAIAQGAARVSDEERERRLDICAQCEFFTMSGRCSKCGCYMRFKAKLRAGQCPVGKW